MRAHFIPCLGLLFSLLAPSVDAAEPIHLDSVGGRITHLDSRAPGPTQLGTCGGNRPHPECGGYQNDEQSRRAMEVWLHQEEGRVHELELETLQATARAREMEPRLAELEVKERAQQERLIRIQEAKDKAAAPVEVTP